MIVLKAHQELVAFDLGMQIIMRHQLQAELDVEREKVIDLEYNVKMLSEEIERLRLANKE